jgi:proline dehydrogenase
MLGRTLILKAAAMPSMERLVRKSVFFRSLVRRFIAGDTLEESLAPCEDVLANGLRVTLDYLGENTHSEAEALEAKSTYIQMLERIDRTGAVSEYRQHRESRPHELEPLNISIKLTQCGLDQGEDFAERNYREVVWTAAERDNFVRIDMESSEYTARTIDIVTRVFRDLPNTGTVLQSYLFRTDEDVERMIEHGMRVRLVKGAYLEPASVAYKEKRKVDEAFVRQSKRLLKSGHFPAIATHDAKIIAELNRFVEQESMDRSKFEYQMLYGIRRDLQENLRKEGYRVRVYVPFGDAWYPYFTRRLAERPANALFILKSLFKG